MSKRPDRLAKEFVAAATEFHRRRLWLEFPGDGLFLVRIPTEELPFVACVLGQEGEEFGLCLYRGEDAPSLTIRVYAGDLEPERFGALVDFIEMSVQPWGSLPDEYRRTLTAAGARPSRDKLVPLAMAKQPLEDARACNRTELRHLVWAMRGILAALDAGRLRVGGLDWRARELIELRVEGELREPRVAVERVPWPADLAEIEPPDNGTDDLLRTDERWFLLRVPVPVNDAQLEKDRNGLLLVNEQGLVLADTLVQEDDLAGLRACLEDGFLGRGADSVAGLPREIVCECSWIHAALEASLDDLGIAFTLDPDDADLRGWLAEHTRAIEEVKARARRAPASLEDWKEKDRNMAIRLRERAQAKVTPRTIRLYFGSEDDAQTVFERYGGSPMSSYLDWLAVDDRPTKRSKTVLEKLLAEGELDPGDAELLEARANARPSLYRVDAVHPERDVTEVEDLMTGEARLVQDAGIAHSAIPGLYVPLRLYPVASWWFPSLAGPSLEAWLVTQAVDLLQELGYEPADTSRPRSHAFGRLWRWASDDQRRAPTIRNMDGEVIAPHSATFKISDFAALQRILEHDDDFDFDDGEGAWIWLEAAPASGPRRVLGRFEVLDDRLLVETGSKERLVRARTLLEATDTVTFERATGKEPGSDSAPLDDRLPAAPQAEPSASEKAAMEELRQTHLLDYYRRWLDEHVPALGNRTPREACDTADGRRQVEILLRSLPAAGGSMEAIAKIRATLRSELGLDEGG